MFCFLHRWRISKAFDTGKAMVPGTRRHIENCVQCRTFARMGGMIEEGLKHDGRELLNILSGSNTEHFRSQRIINSLDNVQHTPSARLNWLPKSRPTFGMRPVYAALLLIVIVSAAALFSPLMLNHDKTPDTSFFSSIDKPFDFPEPPIQKLAVQVESPLNREMESLKIAAASTVEFLKSYLKQEI